MVDNVFCCKSCSQDYRSENGVYTGRLISAQIAKDCEKAKEILATEKNSHEKARKRYKS
jgi:hypothetical protein